MCPKVLVREGFYLRASHFGLEIWSGEPKGYLRLRFTWDELAAMKAEVEAEP